MKYKIAKLKDNVSFLEEEVDRLEQYSCRSNLRFQRLSENKDGEDALKLILEVINDKWRYLPHWRLSMLKDATELGDQKKDQNDPS